MSRFVHGVLTQTQRVLSPAASESSPGQELIDGFRLANYAYSGTPHRSETGVKEVRVSLTGHDGSRVERAALYQVTQAEIISILRVE